MTELEIIEACKKNHYKGQMQLYERYKDVLFNTSYRILKSEADAQDMVHDAFIKAFKSIKNLGEEVNLMAWLKRITINCSLDLIRKQKKVSWLEDSNHLMNEENEQEYFEENQISVAQIKNAIDQLKEKYRIIITLYLIENYTHKEIAVMLHLNDSTVRNQYRRGKAQLLKQLQNKIIS